MTAAGPPQHPPAPPYSAPAPPVPPAPTPGATVPDSEPDQWERLLYLKTPAWLDDWFPHVSNALADGAWTASWRYVAWVAPAVALLLGLLSRLIFRDLDVVYTQSLMFLILVVAGSLLSGTVGVALFTGYVIQDLLVGNRVATFDTGFILPGVIGGKIVSYLLLAIPAMTVPLLSRQLAEGVKIRQLNDPLQRLAARAGINAAICGVLIYLWTQSMIVLIRPLFTWLGTVPETSAVTPVQRQTLPLVFFALAAGAARVVLEEYVAPKGPRARVAEMLKRARWSGQEDALLARLPQAVRVAVASAVVTMVLGGTYEHWVDALLVAVIVGLISTWRNGLLRLIPVPARWAIFVRRWPALLRLLAASLIGYFLANIALAPFFGGLGTGIVTNGLRPVLIGALLTLIAFHLLFPPLPAPSPGGQPQQTGGIRA